MPDGSAKKMASSKAKWKLLQSALSRYICLFLPPERTWYKVKWPVDQIIVGITEGEGQTLAEVRAQLVYAGRRLTKCNVSRWT